MPHIAWVALHDEHTFHFPSLFPSAPKCLRNSAMWDAMWDDIDPIKHFFVFVSVIHFPNFLTETSD